MKDYKGYLIDLDGTMYKGSQVIEGAIEFIDYLNKEDKDYLFVTNNSSKTPEEVAEKLNEIGFHTSSEHVITTAMATAGYISEESPGATVYMVGGTGLRKSLNDAGLIVKDDEHVDYVVMGLDEEITYEKLTVACLAVRNGAKFISTNKDVSIPKERGFLPGNGSLTSVVSVSTGQTPIFIGKPETIIMEQALEKIGHAKEECIMIGDLYDTDILAGINSGIDTLHVHTGVTTFEEIQRKEVLPTYSIKNLLEIIE
ncbi:TIGR01457 family HAD-type hydrolase [Mammaliicoccus lentus]|jgi:4-nitrophenyl phosphatase|uniref:Acid sugar phosphatase n=1 Tax=Mammaliicoccus lentus TaxID=42858 RepID=A0AAX3W6F9_MAMLE|nr:MULTISPECIES: TIGR01457 family HAD-type hydrolase [Mammaliicoccus]HBV03069.1 TIGR01457 family HAD-type hydrolase [Staphylococcus sp.]MBF0794515.1 TIGR01457 family HAD-type hydrolase [Mammaliicoccus lentus]MCR1873617.1 TIGR01457 family HAD-type hydrolase [Mammaliicoccus lentus]MDQ7141438.1 TIGR01457 family HAD-type hydrolase [Mammaliicoccus lentus]MEB5687219.1 TIGR01457 family HAD-type hydrolase [Mammaliicoccus lentus]